MEVVNTDWRCNMKKKKIYVDFDGVIVNSINTVTDIYNEDFKYFNNFKRVDWRNVFHWDFRELKHSDREYINLLFTQPRFFRRLEFMDGARKVLDRLSEKYEIIVVSMGVKPNLRAKKDWIKWKMPYAEFIGVNYLEHYNKEHIDMSDSILFIDDSVANLGTNAPNVAVFGTVYPWNEVWDGERCLTWDDVESLVERLENEY